MKDIEKLNDNSPETQGALASNNAINYDKEN